jgi:hypothetical protein
MLGKPGDGGGGWGERRRGTYIVEMLGKAGDGPVGTGVSGGVEAT